MAEIEKTAPQTQKVWTAQDFRERNKRVQDEIRKQAKGMQDEIRKQAKDMVENKLIPQFIETINRRYNSNQKDIHQIFLMKKTGDTNRYEIEFIDEWAKSLGYELMEGHTEIFLLIPSSNQRARKRARIRKV